MKHGAIKPLRNVGLIPCLQSSQNPYRVSKKCHFLADAGTSGYLGGLLKRNTPKSKRIAGMSDVSAWFGFWPAEATKSSVWRFLIKGPSKQTLKDP